MIACATGSGVTGSCVTRRGTVRTGSMLCACATGICAIPPSGAFSPEVTSVTWTEEALSGSHGSNRVSMHNRYILYYYYSCSTVVPLRMTDRAIGSDVTPEGVPLVRATGSWGFPSFFQVFLDMLCSTPVFSLVFSFISFF